MRSLDRVQRLTLSSLAAATLLGASAFAIVQPPPAVSGQIVPHRAVYDISLARSEEGSGVSNAAGRMVFEITGGACAGYSMKQRMVVNIVDEDGNAGLLDFQIRTFETGSGDRYDFDARTTVNNEVVEAVKGEAKREAGSVRVALTAPAVKIVSLAASTLFPSQHLNAILSAAAADRSFLTADIYEGSGSGETSDAASAAIGKPLAADGESDGGADGGGTLRAGVRHWPVSVGYFGGEAAPSEQLGEEMPSYQMHFVLYENGVTNNLVMDYGKYALSGALKEITPLDEPVAAKACEPKAAGVPN